MRTFYLPALAAALLVCGCTTPSHVSPVEVTRFTGQQPANLATGTIAIDASPGAAGSLPFAAYAKAVESELARLGYQIAGPGEAAAQVARITLDQQVFSPGEAHSPVSVGGGASVGSYGSGIGLGVGIDLTPPAPDVIDTRLAVSIASADGGPNLWEGRASMTASVNSEMATDEAAAARLAAALFADFPGNSGETLVVE